MNSETLTLYASYFETQLSEIEMIQSMYSNRGEFEMDDPSVMADMRTVVEGKSTILPESRLQFTVNLKLDKV